MPLGYLITDNISSGLLILKVVREFGDRDLPLYEKKLTELTGISPADLHHYVSKLCFSGLTGFREGSLVPGRRLTDASVYDLFRAMEPWVYQTKDLTPENEEILPDGNSFPSGSEVMTFLRNESLDILLA